MAAAGRDPVPVPARVDSAALERQVVARFEHWPLARIFFSRTKEREMSERIARAIVKEANYLQVEPSLLAGVLLTENAPLDASARSSQGAIGLMQVMDFHAGEYDCDSNDLLQVEANICHGARVFGYYLKRTGNVQRALLRYNGCVVGHQHPELPPLSVEGAAQRATRCGASCCSIRRTAWRWIRRRSSRERKAQRERKIRSHPLPRDDILPTTPADPSAPSPPPARTSPAGR